MLGAEAGGIVYDCDEDVRAEWLNKRVVFFGMGGFAEYSSVPINRLVKVPDDVSLPTALALTTMGLTAHYLCSSTAKLKPGDHVLVHAAGSGTGRLVAQVAQNIYGATVVGTASTTKLENVPLPRERVVDYSGFPANLSDTLRSKTPDGRGFDIVFDGVGKDTATISLNACRRRGLCVYFGNASGPVPPIDPLTLSAKGSLFVTRPKLHDYVTEEGELAKRASDVFDWVRSKKIDVAMDKQYHSLDHISDALNYVKEGHARGKVVIKVA